MRSHGVLKAALFGSIGKCVRKAVNPKIMLPGASPIKSARISQERILPRNRHGRDERIEARVIESFAYDAG